MSPRARTFRSRAVGLLGAVITVAATAFVGAPVAQADDVRSRQWYLDAMKADDMWKVSTGKGITVAVLDTGVDSTVPELRGKVLSGPDYVDGEGDARTDAADTDRHGTNMAAYIAGTGANGGIKGLAPDAEILPVRVGARGGKDTFGLAKPLSKGLRYAVDHGSRVINISMKTTSAGRQEAELQEAVDYALRKGALIFAGTGNEGEEFGVYPAVVPGVVAVGAVDTKGKVADFSNYGDHVALAAPGADVPGRCNADKNRFCNGEGTSGATALASASAALIWSAHPDWTNNQVLRVMLETAGHNGPVPSKYIGYGTVRPAQVLLEGKGDPGPADVNPLLGAQKNNSPAPQTSPNSPSPESTGASDEGGRSKESQAAPETAARSEEGGFPLWAVVASAVAVVALIGGAVAVSVRSRRA
ncbi:S8 family serine peptidase [Streptomyces sp. TRM49041]|uniref:S8 family serine peptidase n=1 Tax=Streptomyces sp. TRM49041 TaxID=2603216 RepID=UPI0011EE7A32|nr:S8 family serine peptidase [Streptomyces sp. TRM49041]